ncbi:MAG TPA: 3,4-dihydroxy-2-butanone-4-phosphate synthase [Polyangiaceae bacterium]
MDTRSVLLGTATDRVRAAVDSLRRRNGVLVMDDVDRENEGDLIFAAESITVAQMALMIRECSGIVCLCLTEERVRQLRLPMMVEHNASPYCTAFTVSIEAAQGCETGVSAADRVRTIRAAVAEGAVSTDVVSPGHVFPLCARTGGVLVRRGHTEATVDLMQLAGLSPSGVLCELMNPDGTMARLLEVAKFATAHGMPIVTIDDIVQVRRRLQSHSTPSISMLGCA